MSTGDLEYEVLKPDQIDDVIPIGIYEYAEGEPLARAIHATGDELYSFLRQGVVKWLSSGLSVGARDSATGKIIGVLLCGISTPCSPAQFDLETENKKQEIYKLLATGGESKYDPFEVNEVQRVVEHTILAVHRDFRGRKIGFELAKRGTELARESGEEMCIVLATNVITKAIYQKLGYDIKISNFYSDIQLQENVPFDWEATGDSKGYAILAKPLKV